VVRLQVSLVARVSGALGFTLRMPLEDRALAVEDELRGMIAVLLGGRAAERVAFGTAHTYTYTYIHTATHTLRMPLEDRVLAVEDELRTMIAVLLGGRAAERVFRYSSHCQL
jgi:ATP-dependent Zn protease